MPVQDRQIQKKIKAKSPEYCFQALWLSVTTMSTDKLKRASRNFKQRMDNFDKTIKDPNPEEMGTNMKSIKSDTELTISKISLRG